MLRQGVEGGEVETSARSTRWEGHHGRDRLHDGDLDEARAEARTIPTATQIVDSRASSPGTSFDTGAIGKGLCRTGPDARAAPFASSRIRRTADTFPATAIRHTAIKIGRAPTHGGRPVFAAQGSQNAVTAVARQRHTARSARRMTPGGTGTASPSAFALL